jgi:hypothetical protein
MWDMATQQHQAEFTAAAERCQADIAAAAELVVAGHEPTFTHDGDRRLIRHTRNARQYPNRWGTSMWKGHRESPNKIDLAVCMVGARMLRRALQMAPASKGKRSGRVVAWGGR